ncbi:MAG: glutaredoxin [Pyramidobacter sp.]|nr:glutaredoxin [Pyramidobacter sp.]
MKLTVYGTRNCPDTVAALAEYKKRSITVDFRDIDADIATLKEFLTLRDTDNVFAPVRERHGVGVPCVIKEDGTLTLDWESVL